jgi:hypothetical protein
MHDLISRYGAVVHGKFLSPVFAALLLILLPAFTTLPAIADAGNEAFDQGISEFRKGNYDRALVLFQTARRHGIDTPALHYNLGVVWYRLGRYGDARAEFLQILDDPDLGPTAHYNLGMVALRGGNTETARGYFLTARDRATTPGLRRLAERALETVGHRAGVRRWRVLASLAGGYDDNVTLAPQADLVGVSDVDDWFVELLAAARYQLAGTTAGGWRMEGGVYLRQHSEVDRFNQVALRLGVTRSFIAGKWQAAVGGLTDMIRLGGDPFANILTLSLQGERQLDKSWDLHLRYRASEIDADDDFDQLTGWRHHMRSEGRWRRDYGSLHVGHELEWNDRNDLRSGDQFLSLSPLRNGVYVEAIVTKIARWELSARGHYRHSRYRDPHVTASETRTREDERLEFILRAARTIKPGGRFFAAATHTDNDSNLVAYDYKRTEFMAGWEWAN